MTNDKGLYNNKGDSGNLNLSWRIAKKLGGQLIVESQLSKGSTFELSLRLKKINSTIKVRYHVLNSLESK